MIKAIFFDLDGVLTTDRTGGDSTCKYIQSLVKDVKIEVIRDCFDKCRKASGKNKPNESEIWSDISACAGINLDNTTLEDAFMSTPKNTAMFDLCKKLKSNYNLGIITDNSYERFESVQKHMELDSLFNYLILSSNVGSTKTSEGIFNAALSLCHLEPEECVFIDNQKKNLVIPSEMGFRTYWHDDSINNVTQLLNQLIEWGINVDIEN